MRRLMSKGAVQQALPSLVQEQKTYAPKFSGDRAKQKENEFHSNTFSH